jgi:hypothetical protein
MKYSSDMKRLPIDVLDYISSRPRGATIRTREILHLGSRDAVDQALSRLVRGNKLIRVGRGRYIRPIAGALVIQASSADHPDDAPRVDDGAVSGLPSSPSASRYQPRMSDHAQTVMAMGVCPMCACECGPCDVSVFVNGAYRTVARYRCGHVVEVTTIPHIRSAPSV